MEQKKLDQLLEELASILYSIPPIEWNRIIFYSEIGEDTRSVHFQFFPAIDNEPRQSYSLYMEFGITPDEEYEYNRNLSKLMKQIYESYPTKDDEPWNVLTAVVEHTGDYDMYFDYYDFSLPQNEDFHSIWEQKYLVDPPLKQEMDPQQKMDDLINNLAQNHVSILNYNDGIPVDWHRVEFYAEVGEETNSIHYLYYPESDKQPRAMDRLIEENRVHPFDIKNHTEKLGRVVGHLLNAFTEFGNEPWTTIRASIDENGKFGVKFGYEDLSESTEEQRVAQWKSSLK